MNMLSLHRTGLNQEDHRVAIAQGDGQEVVAQSRIKAKSGAAVFAAFVGAMWCCL